MEIEIIAGMGALASALSKAQAAYPAIPRDREVEVQTRTGGKYKFKYAPLDTILNAVRGPLSENGLAVTQLIDGQELVTMLLHESGASLTSKMALPHGDGTAQALGSAITYLRRYSLQAMLGIAAEDDDDGKAGTAAGMTTTPRPQQQAPQRRSLADAVRERSGDALRAPAGPSAAPGSRRSTRAPERATATMTAAAPRSPRLAPTCRRLQDLAQGLGLGLGRALLLPTPPVEDVLPDANDPLVAVGAGYDRVPLVEHLAHGRGPGAAALGAMDLHLATLTLRAVPGSRSRTP